MKKIFKNLFLLVALFLFLPRVSFGAEMGGPLECCELKSDVTLNGTLYSEGEIIGSDTTCQFDNTTTTVDQSLNEWGLVCLMGSAGLISKWVFTALMVISPLMIMLGTYYIVTAGMDPERVGKGKKFIIWAAVGIVVGLFANAIPAMVSSLLA